MKRKKGILGSFLVLALLVSCHTQTISTVEYDETYASDLQSLLQAEEMDSYDPLLTPFSARSSYHYLEQKGDYAVAISIGYVALEMHDVKILSCAAEVNANQKVDNITSIGYMGTTFILAAQEQFDEHRFPGFTLISSPYQIGMKLKVQLTSQEGTFAFVLTPTGGN